MKNKVILNTIIMSILLIISIYLNINTIEGSATFHNLIISFVFSVCLMMYIYMLFINKNTNKIASIILKTLRIYLFIGMIGFIFILFFNDFIMKLLIDSYLLFLIYVFVGLTLAVPFMGLFFILENNLVFPIVYILICCVPYFFYKKFLRNK